MCEDMCVDMCVDMYVDLCVDMCVDICDHRYRQVSLVDFYSMFTLASVPNSWMVRVDVVKWVLYACRACVHACVRARAGGGQQHRTNVSYVHGHAHVYTHACALPRTPAARLCGENVAESMCNGSCV